MKRKVSWSEIIGGVETVIEFKRRVLSVHRCSQK